jgi:hypothetical protein
VPARRDLLAAPGGRSPLPSPKHVRAGQPETRECLLGDVIRCSPAPLSPFWTAIASQLTETSRSKRPHTSLSSLTGRSRPPSRGPVCIRVLCDETPKSDGRPQNAVVTHRPENRGQRLTAPPGCHLLRLETSFAHEKTTALELMCALRNIYHSTFKVWSRGRRQMCKAPCAESNTWVFV